MQVGLKDSHNDGKSEWNRVAKLLAKARPVHTHFTSEILAKIERQHNTPCECICHRTQHQPIEPSEEKHRQNEEYGSKRVGCGVGHGCPQVMFPCDHRN